jgi:uncharacterized alkaline shock family protein YloU
MEESEQIGRIKISDDVVAIISNAAALSATGVVTLSGGIVEGITEFVGKKNPGRGIKVDMTDEGVTVDIYLIVEFGHRIPDVATDIQHKVRHDVQTMTGLNVTAVNIHVQGISFPHPVKEKE